MIKVNMMHFYDINNSHTFTAKIVSPMAVVDVVTGISVNGRTLAVYKVRR